jgi:hypothetical protein
MPDRPLCKAVCHSLSASREGKKKTDGWKHVKRFQDGLMDKGEKLDAFAKGLDRRDTVAQKKDNGECKYTMLNAIAATKKGRKSCRRNGLR